MKRLIFISLFTIVFHYLNYGQNNAAHHWYFGINAGVDFSNGVHNEVTNGQLSTGEGVATVDDSNGNLKFYTDGQEVYNANHQLMPNGTGLLGHTSATQSSIIIPYPNNSNLYYLFTVDAGENHLQNGLRYSLIDMNLDNGMGDIIPGQKNLLLETPVCEKLTAVLHDNGDDVWVLAHRWDSNDFLAYKITVVGLDTIPIVSSIGTIHQGGFSTGANENGWTNSIGYMKASMEGDRLAVAIYRADIVELFDFNKFTGEITNCFTSPSNLPDVYGLAFSPNGNLLYTTQAPYGGLKQFNISQVNPFSNPIIITAESQTSALQLAPNGSIYLAKHINNYLGEISAPNNLGSACNFVSNALYLNGNQSKRGLPCIFINEHFQFITGSNAEVSICAGDSAFLEGSYQNIDGIYVDAYTSSTGIDSFVYTTLTVIPPPTQPIINEYGGVLWSTQALSYQWYTNGDIIIGATGQTYEPNTTGLFSVEIVSDNGCKSMSAVFFYEFISIDEINMNIKIYPNPVNTEFNIEFRDKIMTKIIILNSFGQMVYSELNNKRNHKINTENLDSGLYYLKLTDSMSNYFTFKFCIIK